MTKLELTACDPSLRSRSPPPPETFVLKAYRFLILLNWYIAALIAIRHSELQHA